MDSALSLLKQEINQTMEAEHDLAKWKLAVTAALGVAAFGLTEHNKPCYWLLLFVPFVCAYIDLYAYQYELRIRVIARFLRKHPEGDSLLKEYEQECEDLRVHGKHVFSLGNWAGFACSLLACLAGPLFFYLLVRHGRASTDDLLVSFGQAKLLWFVGVVVVFSLWVYFQVVAWMISKEKDRPATA